VGTITDAARSQLDQKRIDYRRILGGRADTDEVLRPVDQLFATLASSLAADEERNAASEETRLVARRCADLIRTLEHKLGGPRVLSGSRVIYLRDGKGRAATAAGWLTAANRSRDPAAQTRVMRRLRSLRYSTRALAAMRARGVNVELAEAEKANEAAAFVREYHAGHLIADTLGGSGGEENLVPLERRLNLSWGRMAEILVEARVKDADRDPSKGVYLMAQAVYGDDYPEVTGSAAAYLEAMATIPDRIDYVAFERVGDRLEQLANETFHSGQVTWFLPLRTAATAEMIADFRSPTFDPRAFVEKYDLRSR
jgi:DNA/RNA non-specific endonuclease